MDRAILIRTQEPRQEDCFNLLVLSVGNQVSSVAIDRKDTEKDVIVLLPAAIEFDDEEESKISTHRTIWMLVLLVNICLWCERRVAVAGRWWAPSVHAHLNIRRSKFVYQHQHAQTQITTFLSIAASFLIWLFSHFLVLFSNGVARRFDAASERTRAASLVRRWFTAERGAREKQDEEKNPKSCSQSVRSKIIQVRAWRRPTSVYATRERLIESLIFFSNHRRDRLKRCTP